MNRPSNELAIPTTQQLCEQVMHYNGTDRGNGERIRQDADWQGSDIDGDPLKLRLIQQRGMGNLALYTLRLDHATTSGSSVYRYDPIDDSLNQLHTQHDGKVLRYQWPSRSINTILATAPVTYPQPNSPGSI